MREAPTIAQKILSLSLALAIGLPPFVARADEKDKPKLALAPLTVVYGASPGAAPQATADKLTGLLTTQLAKEESFALVTLAGQPYEDQTAKEDAAEPEPRKEGAETVAPFHGAGERVLYKGQTLLSKGRKDTDRLHFDTAVAELQDGIAALEEAFDSLSDFSALTDAYLSLGIAELRLGQRESGEQAVSAAIRLAPERTLAGDYPAVFTRMYANLKAKLTQGAKGTLVVTSVPSGQPVTLDGRSLGPTPLSLHVIPGTHFVGISGDSTNIYYKAEVLEGRTIQVGEGQAPVSASPKPVVRASTAAQAPQMSKDEQVAKVQTEIVANNLDEQGRKALEAISSKAGGAAILFGGIHFVDEAQSIAALDVMLYTPEKGEIAALTRVQFDAELSVAPAELLKVANEVAAHFLHWSDVISLPQPVAMGLKPPQAAPEAERSEEPLESSRVQHAAVTSGATDLGPPEEAEKNEHHFPWLGVGLGVGAAVVVAAGAIVLVTILTQKPGVNPQVTW